MEGRYRKSKCCRADYVCPNMQQTASEVPPSNYARTATVLSQHQSDDVNNVCNYGDKRVDYSDCKKYFSCVGEQKHFERRFCPSGQYFNERLNRCVAGDCQNGLIFGEYYEMNAPCQNCCQLIHEDIELKESSGRSGYRADTENCHKFYQCAHGKWVHKDCPGTLVWNSDALVCDWPQEGQQC
ncbi:unnamed protein product [Anisakis simplex]|uniref:Chitin-binding type-2 domain-containing protein n=1 Tax=Anisakis simplex TaxID=6269 RepID=A0A0M3K3I0_ANISI|nr:unnamed protein product [Anisakis simplex]